MAKLTVTGIDKLEKALRHNVQMSDVKKCIRHHGTKLQQRMQQNADFKKGYQTGQTKRSIGLEMKDDGLTASVGPETEYSPYLEFGTRFMEAQPFVKPAYDDQKVLFRKDLQRLMR